MPLFTDIPFLQTVFAHLERDVFVLVLKFLSFLTQKCWKPIALEPIVSASWGMYCLVLSRSNKRLAALAEQPALRGQCSSLFPVNRDRSAILCPTQGQGEACTFRDYTEGKRQINNAILLSSSSRQA